MENIKMASKLIETDKLNKNFTIYLSEILEKGSNKAVSKPIIASNITGDISMNPFLNKVFIKDIDI